MRVSVVCFSAFIIQDPFLRDSDGVYLCNIGVRSGMALEIILAEDFSTLGIGFYLVDSCITLATMKRR